MFYDARTLPDSWQTAPFMPIDSKLRKPATPVRAASTTPPSATTSRRPAARPSAPGHSGSSEFDAGRRIPKPSEGRRVRNGTDDDSIGVGDLSGRRGTDDDSIGVGDLSGRRGTDDDSIGRGTDDDSIGFGDVVLDSLVGPDNDPDRLALRDALYSRLETPPYLREDAPPDQFAHADLRRVASQLTPVLPGRQGAALLASARADAGVASRLDATLQRSSRLPADVRTSLLQTFASDPSGTAGQVVAHVLGAPAFTQRSAADQKKIAAVMSRLDERGLKAFGALVDQNPAAFDDKDSKGHTLLSNLNQLATQPLNAKLVGETTTEAVISNALVEAANPNRIQQGSAPTCTVASMQYELVADEPAEYMRLLMGLTGPTGKASMRGGGELRVEAEDAAAGALDGRSISQAIFQSAAMEYANGRDSNFDAVAGRSTNKRTGAGYEGLKPNQQTTILRQLFGVKYTNDTLFTEAEGAKAMENLRAFDAVGSQNRPIILEIDQGSHNHAVTLERIGSGRVFFRDPYGVLRSMPEELFPKYVVAIHRPTDMTMN